MPIKDLDQDIAEFVTAERAGRVPVAGPALRKAIEMYFDYGVPLSKWTRTARGMAVIVVVSTAISTICDVIALFK